MNMDMTAYISVTLLIVTIIFIAANRRQIGNGKTYLVPYHQDLETFPFRGLSGTRIRYMLQPDPEFPMVDKDHFLSHIREKYGLSKTDAESFEAAKFSLVVRDRTKTPALIPANHNELKELLSLYLDTDKTYEKEGKVEEVNNLKFKLQNSPDLPPRAIPFKFIKKNGLWLKYYYPRIQVEFSAKLISPSQLDRFDSLGFLIKIDDEAKENVRFIDFEPKAADFFEYARGQLTQASQVLAKTGTTIKSSKTEEGEPTVERSLSPEGNVSMTETFVNELKDSIETRMAGFLDTGQTFFADFRAIKEKRIGGTYSFDLMLEVQSEQRVLGPPDGTQFGISQPKSSLIKADVFMFGVVRHVAKQGFTGWVTRVPEPSNDTVFQQVIITSLPGTILWEFSDLPRGEKIPTKPDEKFIVEIISNRDEATYCVVDSQNNVLGYGQGRKAKIEITAPKAKANAEVKFLDITLLSEKGTAITLKAAPESLEIPSGKSGSKRIFGNYTVS